MDMAGTDAIILLAVVLVMIYAVKDVVITFSAIKIKKYHFQH